MFKLCFIQAGNSYEDDYPEITFNLIPIIRVKLLIDEPKIVFEPALRDIKEIIHQSFIGKPLILLVVTVFCTKQQTQ